MSFWKRAFLHVIRKKGKTFLLFTTLLIMATFVLTGLSIWKASDSAQLELRKRLGGQFYVCVDWRDSPYIVTEYDSPDEASQSGEKNVSSYISYSTKQLTPEDIDTISSVAGVAHCSARIEALTRLEDYSLFPGTIPIDQQYDRCTNLMGVFNTADDELFTTGKLSLIEGRHVSSSDYHMAIISQDFAEKNELGIGDFLIVHGYNPDEHSFTGAEIKIEIVGLFASNIRETFGESVTTFDKIQNRIFADLQTGLEINGDAFNYGFAQTCVTVDDPQNMAKVIADVKKLSSIDWKAFTVYVDNEVYEQAAAPLAALNELIMTLLIVIILVSAIILALLLTMWTKTRIHETGILLALGIKKASIIGQYLVEVMIIAFLAFGLSYFTSNAMAGQIGNHLLQQSVQEEKEDVEVAASFSAAEVGADTYLEESIPIETGIRVEVGVSHLIQVYLIGFVIIMMAVGISSITVMRLKPREILSKMN